MEDLGFSIFDKNKINDVLNETFTFWNVDEQGNIFDKTTKKEIPIEHLTFTNWLNHIMRKNEKLPKVNSTLFLLKH